MNFQKELAEIVARGELPEKYGTLILQFYESCVRLPKNCHDPHLLNPAFMQFVELVQEQCISPYLFEPYHKRIRAPIDYYTFGLSVIEAIIDKESSSTKGLDQVEKMKAQLAQKENVILLANHQTECDPQVISVLLKETHPQFAEEMIFVAGERVLIDPMAVPFSMGRDLICVYSKKYTDTPPERRSEKLAHNQKSMRQLCDLLNQGGKAIYVAPSGGRDRPTPEGEISPTQFDPAAVELFRLLASRASRPSHFYPLALKTYNLLPPPDKITDAASEPRFTRGGGAHLYFGEELTFDAEDQMKDADRKLQRNLRAEKAWKAVCALYDLLP